MLLKKPKSLPTNKELVCRIVAAFSEHQDCGPYERERFLFKMRVYKKSDLSRCWTIEERMYNGGKNSDYLVEFVQNATGEEFIWFWSDVEFTIGAIFIGMVIVKVKTDYYNRKTVFFNTVALRHLGYWSDAEEGENK